VSSCKKTSKASNCVIVRHLKRPKNSKRKAHKIEVVEWRPDYLGDGIYDLIFMASPKLGRYDFAIALKEYLKEWNFGLTPDRGVIAGLHKKTCYCLQQRDGLDRMREVIQSKDWNRRAKVIGKLNRDLRQIQLRFNKYRTVKLPLTDSFVRFVIGRVKIFAKSLRKDLAFQHD
jgi:hypothetical protein